MQALLQLLNGIRPMSGELQRHLLSILRQKDLKRGDLLLRKGQVCRQICFINKGLLHSYQEKDDKRITSWLMKEFNVIVSVKSFFLQAPSDESIEALEESELYYITYSDLKSTCLDFIEFNFHRAELLTRYYVLENDHRLIMQKGSAIQRLQWFLQTFPDLIQRVPARHIASFLGLREETMSRIRSQLWL